MQQTSSEIDAELLWSHSREGWLRVDWPNGYVRDGNAKAADLCGCVIEDLIGQPFWRLFDPDSLERLKDWIAEWQRSGKPGERAGVWLHRHDGVSVPITVRVVRISANRANPASGRQCFVAFEDLRSRQSLVARLDQAEARLDETARVARIGWWEWDIAADIVVWSESMHQVLGVPASEFGGTMSAFLQGVHPDDVRVVRERLNATLNRGVPFVVSYRVVRKDESIRYMHIHGRASRDDDGRLLRLYGTCQDVTDREVALTGLRASEQKYRDLVETSNEIIWSLDEQGVLRYVNQAMRDVYGYEPEERIGKPFMEFVAPDRLEENWLAFQSVLAGEPLFNFETVHLHKDGGRIDLSINAIALRDVDHRVIGASGTASNITDRKRNEQLLKERESWFRAIFENAPQCLMTLTVDGQLLDLNPTGSMIFQPDPETPLIGRNLSELLTQPSRASFIRALSAVSVGSAQSWQAEVHSTKETWRWLEGQLVPLRDSQGHIVRLLAAAQDVTARRKADAFREGEQQVLEEIASGRELPHVLRTLIKMLEMQLPGALCSVMLLSDEAAKLIVAATSPMPDGVSEQIASVVVAAGGASFADAVVTGQRRIVEDTAADPSWQELRAFADQLQLRSCWAQPIRGFSNEVLGVLTIFFVWPKSPGVDELQLLDTGAYLAGIAIDRTRSEQALRDSEKRFRTLFEHSPDAIFVESLTGIILDVNPAACALHDMSRTELVGKHVLELVPSQYHEDVQRDFPKLASGELRQLEGFSLSPTRGEIPVSLHVNKTEYAFHEAILFHVRDISERKRAEEKAREAESQLAHVGRLSLMGELMAGISHEINQPLFAIANFANACEKTLIDSKLAGTFEQSDRLLDWTHRIAEQANRAGEIIRRMRDFSRKSTPHRSTVDVYDMIMEATELVVSETRDQHIDLRCEIHSETLKLLGDRIQIQQTLVNLLRNAYRAMRENSPNDRRVILRTEMHDDRILQISVRDNGHGFGGIDPEQIFNPFFTTRPDGLGLGLTISRSIVEAHGGKLWAEQNADQGATFLFTLPLGYDGDSGSDQPTNK